MQRWISVLSTALALAAAPAVHAQTSWDVALDFTLDANPAGTWSYQRVAPTGEAVLLTGAGAVCPTPCVAGLSCWASPDTVVRVGINPTDRPLRILTPLDFGCIGRPTGWIPAGTVALKPSPADGEGASVSWVAPATAAYRFTGAFRALTAPRHVDAPENTMTVRLDGTVLRSKTLARRGASMTFDFTRALEAGKALEFTADGDVEWVGLQVGVVVVP